MLYHYKTILITFNIVFQSLRCLGRGSFIFQGSMAGTCSATSDLSPSLRGEATAGEWRASASGDQQGASHWMLGTIGNRKTKRWLFMMGWGRLGLKVMERETERERFYGGIFLYDLWQDIHGVLLWDCFGGKHLRWYPRLYSKWLGIYGDEMAMWWVNTSTYNWGPSPCTKKQRMPPTWSIG